MRIIFPLFTALVLGAATASAQERACTNELRVDVRGLRRNTAPVLVGVYDSPQPWLRKAILAAKVDPANGLRTVIGSLPPGEYAATAFQDLNDNGKLDTNFIGIPTEPFAFSNGAKGFMGPAKFEQARFKVDACGAELALDFSDSH